MLMTKAAVATYFRCFNMRLPPLWPRANQLAGGRRISLSPLIAHRRCDRNETDSFPAHAHAARQTSAHRISRWTHGRRYPAPGCTIARSPLSAFTRRAFRRGRPHAPHRCLRAAPRAAAVVSTDMSVWLRALVPYRTGVTPQGTAYDRGERHERTRGHRVIPAQIPREFLIKMAPISECFCDTSSHCLRRVGERPRRRDARGEA